MSGRYVIVNDAVDPPAYYTGQGFLIGVDTVVEESDAKVYYSLTAATVNGPLHLRADLYALGWRVVPLSR